MSLGAQDPAAAALQVVGEGQLVLHGVARVAEVVLHALAQPLVLKGHREGAGQVVERRLLAAVDLGQDGGLGGDRRVLEAGVRAPGGEDGESEDGGELPSVLHRYYSLRGEKELGGWGFLSSAGSADLASFPAGLRSPWGGGPPRRTAPSNDAPGN
jgi:hypothetical protein